MDDNSARNIIIFSSKKLTPKGLTNNTAWIIYACVSAGGNIEEIAKKYNISPKAVVQIVANVRDRLKEKGIQVEGLVKKVINKGWQSLSKKQADIRNNEIYSLYYDKGYTQQQLADKYNLSKPSVSVIIAKINREKGYPKGKAPTRLEGNKISAKQAEQIYQLAIDGVSRKEIANAFNVSANTVTAVFKKVVANKEIKGEKIPKRKFPQRIRYNRVSDEVLNQILADHKANMKRKEMCKKYGKSIASIDYCIKKAKKRFNNK